MKRGVSTGNCDKHAFTRSRRSWDDTPLPKPSNKKPSGDWHDICCEARCLSRIVIPPSRATKVQGLAGDTGDNVLLSIAGLSARVDVPLTAQRSADVLVDANSSRHCSAKRRVRSTDL